MQSTLCGGMTSSKWKVFESLLFLGLFLFFVSRVATSVEKLRAAKVSTTSVTAQSEKQFFPAITVCTSRLEQGVTCPEMRVQDAPLNRTVESVAFKMHLGFDGARGPYYNLTHDSRGENLHFPGLEEPATWAFPCLTLEPRVEFSVGYAGAVNLHINVTNATIVYIYAYTPGIVFMSNTENTFGSVVVFSICGGNSSDFFQDFHLHKTQWTLVNQPSFRCGENEGGIGPEVCIDRYLESHVGCSSRLQRTPKNLRICTSDNEYQKWSEAAHNLSHVSEDEIFKVTGCLAPCRRTEYKLTPVGGVKNGLGTALGPERRTFWLRILYPNAKYEIKEQYFVYDHNSFIADVGGYLGLLLGHSLFSIGCSMKDVLSRLVQKI